MTSKLITGVAVAALLCAGCDKKDGKGAWLFILPEVPEQVVVPWILSQHGDAIPLEPPEIVEAVKTAAAALLAKLSD